MIEFLNTSLHEQVTETSSTATQKDIIKSLNTIQTALLNAAPEDKVPTWLQDTLVDLSGQIATQISDWELERIRSMTLQIEERLEMGQTERLAQKLKQLKKQIERFCSHTMPCKEGRKVLAQAREILERADALLTGKPWEKKGPSAGKEFSGWFDERELALMGIELFEVAELFYFHKLKEGTTRFNQLGERIKNRYLFHCVEVGGDPFQPLLDPLKVALALVALAYEITDSSDGKYPNPEDLDQLFQEVVEIEKNSALPLA